MTQAGKGGYCWYVSGIQIIACFWYILGICIISWFWYVIRDTYCGMFLIHIGDTHHGYVRGIKLIHYSQIRMNHRVLFPCIFCKLSWTWRIGENSSRSMHFLRSLSSSHWTSQAWVLEFLACWWWQGIDILGIRVGSIALTSMDTAPAISCMVAAERKEET
jgi:hypothetical protein